MTGPVWSVGCPKVTADGHARGWGFTLRTPSTVDDEQTPWTRFHVGRRADHV